MKKWNRMISCTKMSRLFISGSHNFSSKCYPKVLRIKKFKLLSKYISFKSEYSIENLSAWNLVYTKLVIQEWWKISLKNDIPTQEFRRKNVASFIKWYYIPLFMAGIQSYLSNTCSNSLKQCVSRMKAN